MDIFRSRSKFKNVHGRVLDFNALYRNLLFFGIKFKKFKLNVTDAREGRQYSLARLGVNFSFPAL
jgi:hypothetical protein